MSPERPPLRLLRNSFPGRAAYGTAVSDALLRRIAAGELPATLRLHRPGAELALSKQDALSPGLARAAAAGRAAGFEPVLRLAGGRAAAFHEGTLAFSWSAPAATPARATRDRFQLAAGSVARALRRLDVDAHVGEIPGEYCPGAWSVNARGATKLAGIGQRLIAGGAHVGGVVVVDGSDRLRALLEDVYGALELRWDPATVGSVEDEVGPVSLTAVEDAILTELSGSFELVPAELDPQTMSLASRLEDERRLE